MKGSIPFKWVSVHVLSVNKHYRKGPHSTPKMLRYLFSIVSRLLYFPAIYHHYLTNSL